MACTEGDERERVLPQWDCGVPLCAIHKYLSCVLLVNVTLLQYEIENYVTEDCSSINSANFTVNYM